MKRPIAAAFEQYAAEYLKDATPEQREQFKEAFYAGAAITHRGYADPAKSFGQQRNLMRKVASDIGEFACAAALKERKRA